MRSLEVKLSYASSDHFALSPLALPLKVLDADGGIIEEGAASGSDPAVFQVPQQSDPVFVRLTWPSGSTQTKRIDFKGAVQASVTFTDDSIERNKWSAWAVPRLNEKSDLANPKIVSPRAIGRYDSVWLRLWKFQGGVWSEASIKPVEQQRNDAARQIDFDLPANPWLVQIGGTNVPWRFISLPGGGRSRVFLTTNASTDPRAETLKVVVTGFRSDAETLLEFLSRDSIRAAKALAEFQPIAVRLLAEKVGDPVGAVAGAYFLLRTGAWNRVPAWWFDNLANMFPWIPDGAIIRCVVMIRSGLKEESEVARARGLLMECQKRGLPIFAEGLSLMQEVASVLRPPGESANDGRFGAVQTLAASVAWAGAAFSFYGVSPEAPSPVKVVGYPSKKRVLNKLPRKPRSAGQRTVRSSRTLKKEPISGVSTGDDSQNRHAPDQLWPVVKRPKGYGTLLFLGDIGQDETRSDEVVPGAA